MRPFALFYVWHSSIYFLLFSELKKDAVEDGLPPPFQLGPFLFGKNRVSLLTFGPRELRIERIDTSRTDTSGGGGGFRLSQGNDLVELNEDRPAAFYNLVQHRFETTTSARHAQIYSLAKLSFDNLYNADPDMLWISNEETRYNLLYICNGEVSDDVFGQILKDCEPFVSALLDNDPHERTDRGDFEGVVKRARIIFGVLAHFAHSFQNVTVEQSLLLPVTTFQPRKIEPVPHPPRALHLPWETTAHRLPSITTQPGSPSPNQLSASSPAESMSSSNTYDIVLTPMPRSTWWSVSSFGPTPKSQESPLIRKFASLGPREVDEVDYSPPSVADWQGPPLTFTKLPMSPTELSAASTTEGSAPRIHISDECF